MHIAMYKLSIFLLLILVLLIVMYYQHLSYSMFYPLNNKIFQTVSNKFQY